VESRNSDWAEEEESQEREESSDKQAWKVLKKCVWEFIAFNYEGEIFLGEIIEVKKEEVIIKAMQWSCNHGNSHSMILWSNCGMTDLVV
jgi:hypothetical protein